MKSLAILIRHGESLANAKNIISEDLKGHPLTEKGIQQCFRTGQTLKGAGKVINKVYSSPIQRAVETATEIMKGMEIKKEIEVDERLTETHFGKYNNSNFSDFPKFHKTEFGIESFERNGERMLQAINDQVGVNLFFSHALPIKALICNILNLEEEDASGISIDNASITVIDPEKRKIYSVGSVYISSKLSRVILTNGDS
jgi:broad specificity phosphatase PhoE